MAATTEARWQAYVTSLRQGIRIIYQNKELYDAMFSVRKGSQAETFKAHKLILAARSNEFARILLDPNVPEVIVVDEETVTPTGFDILLRFVYTDEIGTENKKSIVEAYLAAEHYRQQALMEKCERKIDSWTVTQDEVCELLDSGWNIHQLRNKCISFIRIKPNEVISSPSFLKIKFGCLNAILDSGALDTVPVKMRIERIMEWATQDKSSVDYKEVRAQFLRYDPPLLGKLRLETLNVTDFAQIIITRYNGLLEAEEVVNFMVYLSNQDASFLPSWCTPRE